jgi:hypothetical protein
VGFPLRGPRADPIAVPPYRRRYFRQPALAMQSKPATVRKVHRVLSLILALAVKDGRLVRNPADSMNLPRVVQSEHPLPDA